jgi:hypothetical protein
MNFLKERHTYPWQPVLLTWLNAAGAAFAAAAVLFIGRIAWEGFRAGEMGIMVGILMLATLCFLVPWLAAKTVVTIGLFRRRRWAFVLSLVFTSIGLAGSFFTLAAGPVVLLGVLAYLGLMLWSEIVCLAHPRASKKAP